MRIKLRLLPLVASLLPLVTSAASDVRLASRTAHWTRASDEAYAAHVSARNASERAGDAISWAWMAPDWRCSEMSRLGRMSEGGKFVCRAEELATRRTCVIYSFGVSGDVTFETELLGNVLAGSRCQLLAFDPTVKADARAPRQLAEVGARFFETGLVASAARANPDWDRGTLAELMARHGHAHLDLLKIDIEGGEIALFQEMCARGELPFDQLLIELHSGPNLALIRCLELHGFVMFSREENLHGPFCGAKCPRSAFAHSELAFVRRASVSAAPAHANATARQLAATADARYAASKAKRASWVRQVGGWGQVQMAHCSGGFTGPYYLWDLFEPVGWCAASQRTRPGRGLSGGALTLCTAGYRHHHHAARRTSPHQPPVAAATPAPNASSRCSLVIEGLPDDDARAGVRRDVERALGPCADTPYRVLVADVSGAGAWSALEERACAPGGLARDFDQTVLTLRADAEHGPARIARVLECAEASGFQIVHRELDTEYCTAEARGFPAAKEPTIAAFTLLSERHRHGRSRVRGGEVG